MAIVYTEQSTGLSIDTILVTVSFNYVNLALTLTALSLGFPSCVIFIIYCK